MKAIRLAAICSAALVIGACGSRDTALTDADRNEIRAADQKYVDADAKRDTDAMMALLAESVVFMPPGSQPLVGRESVRALFKLHPWDTLKETPAEIEGRADFAIVRGSYSGTAQGMPLAGFYIEVWQKQTDGTWKITRKLWNAAK